MSVLRKKRSDCTLAKLSEEQQSTLAEWLMGGLSYKQAREQVLREWNVKTTESAICEFWEWYVSPLLLQRRHSAAAMAKVGTSALESRKLGYLLDSDVVVPHKDELLFVAVNEVLSMAASGYRAPHKRLFAVAGRSGVATIKGSLVNMRDGGFISAHDFHIASLIAEVVCGGDVDAGTLVSEEYLMTLERRAFGALLGHSKTQERIMGMMSTGKPVRN